MPTPAWPATNVMMLGRVRARQGTGDLRPSEARIDDPDFQPPLRIDYIPTNTTPIPGQNVMQQVVMNGVRGLRMGMGDVSAASPEQQAAEDANKRILWITWAGISAISGVASLYHGYKRNNSLGWGLAWYAMGSLFPLITPTVALAQGYGKRKKGGR